MYDGESHLIQYLKKDSCLYMKWPRYRRVISLKIQVEITSQTNKWANTDPWKYRRWDQVPRRSKHPLPTGRTSITNVPSILTPPTHLTSRPVYPGMCV
jgi:hypothetical protein